MKKDEQGTQVRTVLVTPEEMGVRLDNYLAKVMKKLPKSRLYRAIRHGEVRVNKKRAKPSTRLQSGDAVRIPPLTYAQPQAPTFVSPRIQAALNDAVLYEDEKILVINKPEGMAVHGGTDLSIGVIEALRLMRPEQRYLELVHRLDKGTSGCLVVAKKRSVLRVLHQAIREKQITKIYQAIVIGHWPKHLQKVTLPLRKFVQRSGERIVMVDHEQGKASETLFQPIAYTDECTCLEVRLVTGRTHQIRVHCAQSGHPIINDDKYGKRAANQAFKDKGHTRMALHASRIVLNCPDIDLNQTIDAPLPKALSSILKDND